MTDIEVRLKLDSHLRTLRSLLHMASQPNFSGMGKHDSLINTICCDPDERKRDSALESLKALIKKEKLYESYADLRNEARNLNIPKWSRLDKDGLRAAINARRANQKNIGACNGHSDVAPQGQGVSVGHCIQS